MKMPKLTLVGAGPGDPELITLKAIKAIKNADVILGQNDCLPSILTKKITLHESSCNWKWHGWLQILRKAGS